ncbi:MAG: gamma-glutamyltransferase, partial [Thermoleophilaceae bacterium]
MKGVVAAGHPLTAQAGADVLRKGGNALDAAIAAMLMSWVAESPLTGPGAGGFMLLHTSSGESHLFDFFVAAPGKDAPGPPGELVPINVRFTEDAIQEFHIGPASNGVYGNPLGIAVTSKKFGSMPLADLAAPAARAARDGIEVTPVMRQFFEVLEPILTHTEEARAIYAPDGSLLDVGETIRMPYVGDLIERLGAEGPAFLYEGDVARTASQWVVERGGTLTERDLAEYRVVEREPASARYHGREILTNPPPSSGGILIAYSLDLMERLDPPAEHRLRTLVRVMDRTNKERTRDFSRGLHSEGYLERFLAQEALESAAREVGNPLGNTTHLSVMDTNGASVSVTCSNGSCSGVIVPGTGLHLNNMLGEEDLNPEGHRHEPGARVPSMMAPTLVLHDGHPELAVGSAGSNRIRSAILQTIINVVDRGRSAQD